MSTAELYNQVLDEPNMLECILHHMRNPVDIAHLKSICPSNMTRFHDTIQTVLLEKREDLIEKNVDKFVREVTVYIDQLFSTQGDNRPVLRKLFVFLKNNNVWYKEGMQLHSFDRIIERKLTEFDLDAQYSHNALKSLRMLFHERCLMLNDEDLAEYISPSGLYW
jgi:hypothetical protein